MAQIPRERPHRLPRERYLGRQIVALTSCVLGRETLFADERPTVRFGEILCVEAERHGCGLILACFMPDHVHVLLQGQKDESDAIAAFDRFKLRTSVILDRFYRPTKWQKNYHDHIVRCDQDWRGQARYVCLNPVRWGLVEDAHEHPYFFSSLGTKAEVLDRSFGMVERRLRRVGTRASDGYGIAVFIKKGGDYGIALKPISSPLSSARPLRRPT